MASTDNNWSGKCEAGDTTIHTTGFRKGKKRKGKSKRFEYVYMHIILFRSGIPNY